MSLEWMSFLITGSCFLYLISKIYKKKVALYLKIYIAAIGCFALGKLYEYVTIYSFGALPSGFNLKYVCIFGSYLFLSSANFGVMNHIMDDGSKELRKYRLFSLIAPICIILLMSINIHFVSNKTLKVVYGLLVLPIAFSSYYSLKQLVLPDMDFKFLKLIKPCNIISLVLSLLTCISIYMQQIQGIASFILEIIPITLCLLLTFFITRSLNQWKI